MSFKTGAMIGGAMLGAGTGAVIGGSFGRKDDRVVEGIGSGGLIGGVAGVGLLANSGNIAKGTLRAGNVAAGGLATVGGAALNVGGNIVDSAVKSIPTVGKNMAHILNGSPNSGVLGNAISPVRRHVSGASGFMKSLIDFDRPTNTLNKSKETDLFGKKRIEGGVKLTNPLTGAKAQSAKGIKASINHFKNIVPNEKKAFTLGASKGKSRLGKIAKGSIASTGSIASGVASGTARGVGGIAQGVKGALFNGQTLLTGAAIAGGVMSGAKEYERRKMGTMTGQIHNSTPVVPNYTEPQSNGGASGDLVFALNNLRGGGY